VALPPPVLSSGGSCGRDRRVLSDGGVDIGDLGDGDGTLLKWSAVGESRDGENDD
jgi:hypothetical protein